MKCVPGPCVSSLWLCTAGSVGSHAPRAADDDPPSSHSLLPLFLFLPPDCEGAINGRRVYTMLYSDPSSQRLPDTIEISFKQSIEGISKRRDSIGQKQLIGLKMEITFTNACEFNWSCKLTSFTYTTLRQESGWLFEASRSMFHRFTNRPWAWVLELSGIMLNCLGRDARSTPGGKERLNKLSIGRADERKVMIEWIGRL